MQSDQERNVTGGIWLVVSVRRVIPLRTKRWNRESFTAVGTCCGASHLLRSRDNFVTLSIDPNDLNSAWIVGAAIALVPASAFVSTIGFVFGPAIAETCRHTTAIVHNHAAYAQRW